MLTAVGPPDRDRPGFLLGGEPPALRVAGGGSGDLQVPQPVGP